MWVPAVFLFFEKYLRGGRGNDFLATLLCLTCQTLAGSPEHSILTVLLLYFHSIYVVGQAEINGVWRRTLALGVVVILSIGLASLQLVPTIALIDESVRKGGMMFADHAKWSFKPIQLSNLLLPKDYSQFMSRTTPMDVSFLQSFYMGIIPVIFLNS